MATTFTKLNEGWNGAPNGDDPKVVIDGKNLFFEFRLNDLMYPQYKNAEKGILRFPNCWRYRLGSTNDEGWYRGQCRFSRLAPAWGEFYEIKGDLMLDFKGESKLVVEGKIGLHLVWEPLEWTMLSNEVNSSRHFLFYLRDQTFECDASAWDFSVVWRA
jgi:hypothetical protein